MAASALVLTSLVAFFARDTFLLIKFDLKNILLGVGIAAALWGVFWLGDFLSSLILPFARDQVNSIYAMKEGQSPWMLSALLLLLIGPAEEIFWRGFVQRKLSERWSATKSFLVTTLIYALVHLASLNFMLIMSALVCGLIWGGLYRLIPHRFAAIVLSHALWDAAVFIWWPI
jgi:membrane protease YdiL (CAAX protease family)